MRSETRPCRDLAGHCAHVRVGLTTDDQVTLTTPGGETVVFRPREVGMIRDSLRAAVIAAAQRAQEQPR